MCSQTKSISWSPRKHSSPVGNVSHPVLRPDWAFPMHRLWRPVPCDSKSLQERPLPTTSVSSKNQMLLFTLAQCLTFPERDYSRLTAFSFRVVFSGLCREHTCSQVGQLGRCLCSFMPQSQLSKSSKRAYIL